MKSSNKPAPVRRLVSGYHQLSLLAAFAAVLLASSCHPERIYIDDPEAKLDFTLDTVYFDTVFTTIGTVTRSFRVKNPHRHFVKIDQVQLAGAAGSVFRINVDGRPGRSHSNVEIAPGDSMYVFVEATLDPNGMPGILRIQDSILFLTNGNLQDIDLVAWGQDVRLIRDSVISTDAVWDAEKPYLVLDYAYVDSASSLTIEEGSRVYFHRDALLFVEGSLDVQGTLDKPVLFTGDRLEEFYQDFPGQWGLIYLSEISRGNRVRHAEIRNGTIGILISASPESGLMPDLEISNTLINHMSSNGIYALNARVTARNLVIGECGGSCAGLIYGGAYEFTHCTFANYWRSFFGNRQLPALLLADYFGNYDEEGNLVIYAGGEFEKAEIRNSIIFGNERMELAIDSYEDRQLNYRFDHCLTRIDEDSLDYTSDPRFLSIINNEEPMLDSVPYVFELDSLSPAIDAGLPGYAAGVPFDLNGNNRLADEAPDLGAYERVPGSTAAGR